MDTKSKNINEESIFQEEIKKSNKRKSRSGNIFKKYIVVLLTFISIACAILSLREIKANIRYIIPGGIYLNGDLSNNISDYINLVKDYSIYYKSLEYASDNNNITQNDIDICKAELVDKVNKEYENYRNDKYNEESFSNLTYEEQQKILSEEKEKITEKYTLNDEEMKEYILNRKGNSASDLNNKIKSYVNLNFRAYDKLKDIWIGGEKIDSNNIIKNSKYFEEINIDYNGNVIEKIYVDGKEINNNIISKLIYYNKYSYYTYYDSYEPNNIYAYDYNEKQSISIYIWMPQEIKKGDVVYENLKKVEININRFYLSCGSFILFIILAILCLVSLSKNKSKINIIEDIVNKIKVWPIEAKVGIGILGWISWNTTFVYYNANNYIRRLNLISVIWTSLALLIYYVLIRVIIINYNERNLFKKNITIKCWNYLSEIMTRSSLIKTFLIMSGLYVISGLLLFVVSAILNIFPIGILIGIILTIIYIVIFIKELIYLDKIIIGSKAATEGKLNCNIEEKGRGHLRELAHDINNIRDGLRKSIESEIKSENMKTELITNVSHDLKTPLTSIINYIDLLKRENIESETAKDYINILDKKSQRLKVLIDDLFEASKATSGAMELNITKIDIVQLLKQSLGENDERFKNSNLSVKLDIPDTKIFINGDGQRLYRVFENLISNIVKYSLSNTRVYIQMYVDDENKVVIIMRNISAYELDFCANEITNRFKRGDSSRSTDGSGLGLAIAKSIVELHGGKFNIEVDGDLFKSIIKLNQ
ncbi:HAMP domain-containing sensor histidine kinase [uncultured Clostridium sp.]|uniref:sensor histidine kinase n=1 Tax=uncultured Clostridium sp. TaxID=59620 RepID=UPI0025D9982E|nr:HAMP domain-containing sensor histidine kinase [uncultured Clostridium sp.]